jgi:hypothetical protein
MQIYSSGFASILILKYFSNTGILYTEYSDAIYIHRKQNKFSKSC